MGGHSPPKPPTPKATPGSAWRAGVAVGRVAAVLARLRACLPPFFCDFCYYRAMAVIGYQEIPQEIIDAFRALVNPTSNRRTGAVRKAGYLPSRAQIQKLTTRSLLPQIRDLWLGLTLQEQNAWKAAGSACSMNGWNLFVQDTAYRIKYGIAGLAIPSALHQYKVGRIEINAPSDSVTLEQFHPSLYYTSVKMRGNTTLREDVPISEKLTLPLSLGLSFRGSLTPTIENSEVKFYAEIASSYQGRTLLTQAAINLDVQSSWQRATTQVTGVIGIARSYNLFLRLVGVRGWFEFDNVAAVHSGANFARDSRCNDVNNELTMVNYQIEKSWEEQLLPLGSSFDSVYPAD